MATEADDDLLIPDDDGNVLTALEVTLDEPKKNEPEGGRKASAIIEPEDGIAQVKKQLADEQAKRAAEERRRQVAEQDAAQARQAEAQARNAAQENNLLGVTTALQSAKQAVEVGQAQYAEALAAGDHQRAAAINTEISRNLVREQSLEQQKAQIEAAPKFQPREAIDPVERLARTLSPRSAQWVRKHPEYVTDTRLNRKMLAAHNLVEADGVELDSDQYFDSIERILGVQGQDGSKTVEITDEAPEVVVPRRSAPASAPVSRSGNGTSHGRTARTYTLTPAERDAARTCGMTDEEYAREKLAMAREKERLN
jgi:hypothetical protein